MFFNFKDGLPSLTVSVLFHEFSAATPWFSEIVVLVDRVILFNGENWHN